MLFREYSPFIWLVEILAESIPSSSLSEKFIEWPCSVSKRIDTSESPEMISVAL